MRSTLCLLFLSVVLSACSTLSGKQETNTFIQAGVKADDANTFTTVLGSTNRDAKAYISSYTSSRISHIDGKRLVPSYLWPNEFRKVLLLPGRHRVGFSFQFGSQEFRFNCLEGDFTKNAIYEIKLRTFIQNQPVFDIQNATSSDTIPTTECRES